MKHLLFFIAFPLLAPKISFSQEEQKPQFINYIFDPKANAKEDLQNAVKIANKENKNVFLIIGGDWDYWCRFFNDEFINDSAVINIASSNYVYVRINFSPQNKNEEILTSLSCPKREGYPIFMIFDKNGKKLHTQNADEFKIDRKFRLSKFINFLNSWTIQNAPESLKNIKVIQH